MKKLILIFVLALGAVSYAQTDEVVEVDRDHYVIKTNGDTIFGKLKYTSGEDIKTKITVKVNDTLKYTLKAEEVKYFKDGKNEYITFEPEGEEGTYFLKYWEVGKYLELYEWQWPAEMSGNRIEYSIYVRKPGDKSFFELDQSGWKKQLPDLIEDYEELADEVWRGHYKLDDLGDVVKKYNEWKEENQ